jgi:hypothetical protein
MWAQPDRTSLKRQEKTGLAPIGGDQGKDPHELMRVMKQRALKVGEIMIYPSFRKESRLSHITGRFPDTDNVNWCVRIGKKKRKV